MAGKKGTTEKRAGVEGAEYAELGSELRSDRQAEACPTFVLRADQPGHLRALIAVFHSMPESERKGLALTLREFEMWEERPLKCR